MKSEPLNARQTNQLSGIAKFTTDIRYIEGKSNVVADALSRPSNPTKDEPVDSEPNNFISSVETDRPALDPSQNKSLLCRATDTRGKDNRKTQDTVFTSYQTAQQRED